jgi:hypothetical protein
VYFCYFRVVYSHGDKGRKIKRSGNSKAVSSLPVGSGMKDTDWGSTEIKICSE